MDDERIEQLTARVTELEETVERLRALVEGDDGVAAAEEPEVANVALIFGVSDSETLGGQIIAIATQVDWEERRMPSSALSDEQEEHVREAFEEVGVAAELSMPCVWVARSGPIDDLDGYGQLTRDDELAEFVVSNIG